MTLEESQDRTSFSRLSSKLSLFFRWLRMNSAIGLLLFPSWLRLNVPSLFSFLHHSKEGPLHWLPKGAHTGVHSNVTGLAAQHALHEKSIRSEELGMDKALT